MGYYKSGAELGVFTAAYVQDLERIPTQYRPEDVSEPAPAVPELEAAPEEDENADVG
jgi:hypothetical protein